MSSINPEFYAPYDYEAKVPTSRHNLSTKVSFTCQTGELIPFYHRRVYVKDDFYINPLSLVQSVLPLNRPLLDCFEMRIETYFCPLSNYYGYIDNNSRETVDSIMTKSPKWNVPLFGYRESGEVLFDADFLPISGSKYKITPEVLVNQRVNPDYNDKFVGKGSLMSFLGIPAGFCGNASNAIDVSDVSVDFLGNTVNIEPFLCYLDIVRSYHVNTQYESIPFLNGFDANYSPDVVGPSGGDYSIFDTPFTHQQLDDLFVELRMLSKSRNPEGGGDLLNNWQYKTGIFVSRLPFFDWLRSCQYQHGGFFCVQHRPDLWRNLLSLTNTNYTATVTVTGGTTTIDEIRQKSHLQILADRVYLSGGRYKSLMKTVMGYTNTESLHMPELLGVTRHLIDPSNITAMSESSVDGNTVSLGQKAANIDKFNVGGRIRVRPRQDGYLMCVCSITPLVTYGQGFNPNALRLKMMDDFTPQMQRIGFSGVPRAFYSVYPDTAYVSADDEYSNVVATDLSEVVGKTGKWIEEMTDVNHCYGEFTPEIGLYSDMVLSRKYSRIVPTLDNADNTVYNVNFDLSPYVNPLDYNDVFALQGLNNDPWSIHITMRINAKRPILKRFTPTME